MLVNDAEGELVFTTLTSEAMPLIRYRTHDICKLIVVMRRGASTLKKIGKIIRRLEAIVKIGGRDELFPSMFHELIFIETSLIIS